MPDFSYTELQDIVQGALGSASAAHVHGLLSGLLCVDSGAIFSTWLNQIGDVGSETLEADEAEALGEVFETTRRHLDEFDFQFELLLPDDEFSLSERARALAEWCTGFLLAIGYTGAGAEWPGDCTEILQDFAEIAKLEARHSDDTAESDFLELAEYVRVGAQVIRSELGDQASSRIH